jgi:FMN reductase
MRGVQPFVVGIGGTTRPNSTTELAVRAALTSAASAGASTAMLCGQDLDLPLYSPTETKRTPAARRLLELVRRCDGLIIGSPGYHGSMSGMVKNALDYLEDLKADERVYIDGIAVGCIACASGAQAVGGTLAALRSVVHALRGWPTPFGVGIISSQPAFDASGACLDPSIASQLGIMAEQVVEFARAHTPPPVLDVRLHAAAC